MITHYEVAVRGNPPQPIARAIQIDRGDVRFKQFFAVHIEMARADFDRIARQPDHALDERFRAVQRIPEHHYIVAIDGLEAVHKFIDEDALLVAEERRHTGAFHLHRLIEENDNDE